LREGYDFFVSFFIYFYGESSDKIKTYDILDRRENDFKNNTLIRKSETDENRRRKYRIN